MKPTVNENIAVFRKYHEYFNEYPPPYPLPTLTRRPDPKCSKGTNVVETSETLSRYPRVTRKAGRFWR